MELQALLLKLQAEYETLCQKPDLEAIRNLEAAIKEAFPRLLTEAEQKGAAKLLLKNVVKLRMESGGHLPVPASDDAPPGQAMEQLLDLYYAGEYKDAVKLAAEILSHDPDNDEALRFRAKAEDHIMRGVVPDVKLPLKARVAYNRGTAAARAGLYDAARALFEEADRVARDAGIDKWADVEHALLNLASLDYVRELREQGDDLVKRDRWDEALQMYESALAVVDDSRTRRKLDALNKLSQDHKALTVRIEHLTGACTDRGAALLEMRHILAAAQTELPHDSARLRATQETLTAKSGEVEAELRKRGLLLYEAAVRAGSIAEQLRLAEEACRALSVADGLSTGSVTDPTLSVSAQTLLTQVETARAQLDRARLLLSRRDPCGLSEARSILGNLSKYGEDVAVRTQVSHLLAQIVEQAQVALETGEAHRALGWLRATVGSPFSILATAPQLD